MPGSEFRSLPPEQFERRWQAALETLLSGDGPGAVFQYKSLAADGCASALFQLGRIYEDGLCGVEQDFGEALTWFRHSIETVDDVASHLAVARIYLQTREFDPDRKLSQYHLELLAQNDVPAGHFGLGLMSEHGLTAILARINGTRFRSGFSLKSRKASRSLASRCPRPAAER